MSDQHITRVFSDDVQDWMTVSVKDYGKVDVASGCKSHLEQVLISLNVALDCWSCVLFHCSCETNDSLMTTAEMQICKYTTYIETTICVVLLLPGVLSSCAVAWIHC